MAFNSPLLPRESFRVVSNYVYDDKGERIMKSSVIQSNVYVNDQIVNTIQDLEPYTLYVNPYFVITEFSNADKVSKHYYMGTQRVASELAVQTTSYSPMKTNDGSSSSASSSTEAYKVQANSSSTLDSELEPQYIEQPSNPWLNNLNEALSEFGENQLTVEEAQKDLPTIESIYPDLSPTTSYKTTTTTRVIYWYHPDYIGNVDLVSDNSGEAYEFFLYNPWGESLYEWNSGTASFSSPYRFNGKELDEETGLAYYGARYYDNQLSMWLSVDPKAHWYPSHSTYNFSLNNPVNLVDPNGMWVEGGGFFNNLLYSDDKVVQKMAQKHADNIGGVLMTVVGGYRVIEPSAPSTTKDNTTTVNVDFKDFYVDRLSGDDPATEFAKENKETLLNIAQDMQDVGDATAVIGYSGAVVGAGVAGVGAAPGLAVAGAGELTSTLGSFLEISTNWLTGSYSDAKEEAAWVIGGKVIDVALDKIIPGPTRDMSKESADILRTGNAILKRGASLKYTGIERLSKRD